MPLRQDPHSHRPNVEIHRKWGTSDNLVKKTIESTKNIDGKQTDGANKSKVKTEDKIFEKTDKTKKINNDSNGVSHDANIENVEEINTSSIEEKE